MSEMAKLALTIGDGLQWLGVGISPLALLPFILLFLPELPQRYYEWLIQAINTVCDYAMRLACILIILMAVTQLGGVIIRYVFGLAFTWMSEMIIYAYAGCFLLAAPAALRLGMHVRVDILYAKFTERQRAIVEMVGFYLFILPIMLLILNAFAPSLATSWRIFEKSPESDGLPLLFLFKSLIPVFAGLFLAQGWAMTVDAARRIRQIPVKA